MLDLNGGCRSNSVIDIDSCRYESEKRVFGSNLLLCKLLGIKDLLNFVSFAIKLGYLRGNRVVLGEPNRLDCLAHMREVLCHYQPPCVQVPQSE